MEKQHPALLQFLNQMAGIRQPQQPPAQPPQEPQPALHKFLNQMAGIRRPQQPQAQPQMQMPPEPQQPPPTLQQMIGVQNGYQKLAGRNPMDTRRRIAMMLMGTDRR